jgi:hypothetical protein
MDFKESNIINFDEKEQVYIFKCPHCYQEVQVPKLGINCTIFRHGAYKTNATQIPPHSKKEVCDELFKLGKIYGCGKPFLFDGNNVTLTYDYN